MTIKNYLLVNIIVLICFSEKAYNQCACMGGAPVGGFTPVGGTTNIGILRKGNLRVLSFFSYSNGDKYYYRDSPLDSGLVRSFNSSYTGLLIGYGIFEDFTIDAEFGFFINKSQDFGSYTLSGSGFSHTTIYGKYNVYSSRANEWEWTIGLGGKIPLNFNNQNLQTDISNGRHNITSILNNVLSF